MQVEQQEASPSLNHLLSHEGKTTSWGSSLWRIPSSPESTIGFGRVTCHLAGFTRAWELPGLPLPGNKTDPSFKESVESAPMDSESFRASLGQRLCTITKHFQPISMALYPLHTEKFGYTGSDSKKWQKPLRCPGLSLSLELSFLGSLRYFTWYGNRNTKLSAIVETSVTHISSFGPVSSPADTQTQSKQTLGCLWPSDLCSQSEWEWDTLSSKTWATAQVNQQYDGTLRETNFYRCDARVLEILIQFLIIHMTRYIGYYISKFYLSSV